MKGMKLPNLVSTVITSMQCRKNIIFEEWDTNLKKIIFFDENS